MDDLDELRSRARYHESEARRLRDLAKSNLREAEEHERRHAAYDLVLRDLPATGNRAEQPRAPKAIPQAGSPPVPEDGDGEASEALIKVVREVVAQQNGRFMVEDVRMAVEARAPEVLRSARPRSLTKALWRLAQLKEIRQVRPGHGSRPAIYVNR